MKTLTERIKQTNWQLASREIEILRCTLDDLPEFKEEEEFLFRLLLLHNCGIVYFVNKDNREKFLKITYKLFGHHGDRWFSDSNYDSAVSPLKGVEAWESLYVKHDCLIKAFWICIKGLKVRQSFSYALFNADFKVQQKTMAFELSKVS